MLCEREKRQYEAVKLAIETYALEKRETKFVNFILKKKQLYLKEKFNFSTIYLNVVNIYR